jgi:hypothetical protein
MSTELATTVDGLEDFGGTGLAEYNGGVKLANVSFFGSKTKEPRLTTLKDAGVKPGSFYLKDDAGIITRDPFVFWPTTGIMRCFAKNDENGKVEAVRAKVKDGWRPRWDNPDDKGWSDFTLALVLVPIGDAAIAPALIRTFRAVDNIWKPLAASLEMAANEKAWAMRGSLYAEAAKARYPFGRLLISPWTDDEVKKNAKKKDDVFTQGYSKVVPTPAALVDLFNTVVTPDFIKPALQVFVKVRDKLVSGADDTKE